MLDSGRTYVKANRSHERKDGPIGLYRSAAKRRIIQRIKGDPLPDELRALNGRIRTILDALESGDEIPSRSHIESTLTDGYARALQLDAECRRIEARIAKIAPEVAQGAEAQAAELSKLARRLARCRRDLTGLRRMLASLRAGAQGARVA